MKKLIVVICIAVLLTPALFAAGSSEAATPMPSRGSSKSLVPNGLFSYGLSYNSMKVVRESDETKFTYNGFGIDFQTTNGNPIGNVAFLFTGNFSFPLSGTYENSIGDTGDLDWERFMIGEQMMLGIETGLLLPGSNIMLLVGGGLAFDLLACFWDDPDYDPFLYMDLGPGIQASVLLPLSSATLVKLGLRYNFSLVTLSLDSEYYPAPKNMGHFGIFLSLATPTSSPVMAKTAAPAPSSPSGSPGVKR